MTIPGCGNAYALVHNIHTCVVSGEIGIDFINCATSAYGSCTSAYGPNHIDLIMPI